MTAWVANAAREAPPEVLALGADFDGGKRVVRDPVVPPGRPALLCVGIVEPPLRIGVLAGALRASVRAAAASTLAFGPQTWPHALARAMLAEQLYRAVTILAGSPYHRD